MPEVIIRQSRNRGSGVVIAVIILAVLACARFGPRLGRMQDRIDIQRQEEQRREAFLKNAAKDTEILKQARESGKLDEAARQSLDNMKRFLSDKQKKAETEVESR